MKTWWQYRVWAAMTVLAVGLGVGCDANFTVDIPDLGDVLDDVTSNAEVTEFATKTDGASGLAVRPSDGALFLVNSNGLFGPILEGDDVSTLDPIGATNLADPALFGSPPSATVLAISDAGEFWIGAPCCKTMGVVPAGGGDAEPFSGLLEGIEGEIANISPETLAFVPSGFDGPEMKPGNLLVGEETTFSRLAAIDVDTRTSLKVDNPLDPEDADPGADSDADVNREAHHIAFGPNADGDVTLYGANKNPRSDESGLQSIAPDGTPTALAGTDGVSADTFVVLDNGDLFIDGQFPQTGEDFRGLFFWSAEDEAITEGMAISSTDRSADDELVMAPDGTIYFAQPRLNRIVIVTDTR